MTADFNAALVRELERLRPLARHMCRGGSVSADDLLQDTALKALAGRHQYVEANFGGWVATIMRNEFRHSLRSSKLRATLPLDEATDYSPMVQPGAEWAAMLTDAREAIETLDLDRRAAMVGELLGATYEEMATDHGVKIGTIKSRINRARAFVRAKVDGKIRVRIAA